MYNTTTKISIIVPCYNQAEYLDDALDSILNQSFKEWECIIVNDGSPDNTESIAKNWVNKDNRFKYTEIMNGGIANARNIGIKMACGEFILPLDSDDKLSSDYLKKCLAEFIDESIKIVYGKLQFFGEKEGESTFKRATLKNLLKTNSIHCSGMFRKKDWELNEGYDTNMKYGYEDWEFWINILRRGGEVELVNQCSLHYRIKVNSRSTELVKNPSRKSKMRDYIFQKHLDLYGYQYSYEVFLEKLEFEKKLSNVQLSLSWKELLSIVKFKIGKVINKNKSKSEKRSL